MPVATVDAIATNEPVQAGLDRFNGINGFAKDPDLDHVARFPVVRSFREAGRDDDPLGVFVDYEAVGHREPPLIDRA